MKFIKLVLSLNWELLNILVDTWTILLVVQRWTRVLTFVTIDYLRILRSIMIDFFINGLVYCLILYFCLVWFTARIRSFYHWFILICSFLNSIISSAGSLLSFYYKELAVDVRGLLFLWRAAWCLLSLWFLVHIIYITSLDREI